MDLVSLLIWLSGPGMAIVSAFILERLAAFDGLSSNGKTIVATTVALLLGLAAVAAQQVIVPNSELVAQLNPYVAVVVAMVSLLAQQLAHGAQNNRNVSRSIERARDAARQWGDDDETEDDGA